MAVSDTPFVPGDGQVEILGAGGATLLTLVYENGDFTGTLTNITDRRVIYDRDAIAALRKGKQAVQTGGFSVHALEFTNASAATIRDVVAFTGSASGNTGTTAIPSDYNMVDLRFTADKTAVSDDNADAAITYTSCVLFGTWGEGEPAAVFNFSFESHGDHTVTGQT